MNNRVILSLVAFFIACSTWTVQAQKNKEVNMKTSKILVAYFSVTGTTENVAKNIAEITNGELYKIVPSKSYTNADLDWNDKKSRSSVEMNNPQSRPALKSKMDNIQKYDINCVTHYFLLENSSVGERPAPRGGTTRPRM